jgi:PAS domain S-box-containing protein
LPPAKLDTDNEQLFRLMVANVRDYAIFMLDPTGHIATWNLGAERIKGYRADEIIGRHFSAFYPEVDVKAGKCEYELEVAEREGRFEDENWRVRKDGTQFWANVVITAVRDGSGTLVGFAKVTRDLTERKRAEAETAARLAAEEASRTKDAFLAMLGHELRNPLAPILTALQLLKLRGDNFPLKEHEIIERQVKHMMHLVDDLLDVSRISKGKLELRRRPIDVRQALAKAIETVSPMLEQYGHNFQLDVPQHALGVDADEARLTQVFVNLLTNAAKYTQPGGHISVSVSELGSQLEIAVVDDGQGIEPELLPRVFELFAQGQRGVERAAGGLGIGLTLVHRLVEMHGGTVTAESGGKGQGSRFVVRLPAHALAPAAAKRSSTAMKTVAARRVLIVDDNEDALVLLAVALRAYGHVVETASDGAQALEILDRFEPEVAILDIGLPVMDGYELAAKIRTRREDTAPRMIALTGYGQPTDREKSRAAGFIAHHVKPIDVKQLIEIIVAS